MGLPRFLASPFFDFPDLETSIVWSQDDPAMTAISSIQTSGDGIEIINQLLLPHAQEWIKIDSIENAYEAIKSMKVRYASWGYCKANLSCFFRCDCSDSRGTGHWFPSRPIGRIVYLGFSRPGTATGLSVLSTQV